MSALLTAWALTGWAATIVLWRGGRRRTELVARACHEVRGPLTAARLAVACAERAIGEADGSGTGDPWLARHVGRPVPRDPLAAHPLRAVDRELARAADLLTDVVAAPHGLRPPHLAEAVDVAVLLRRTTDAWRPAARLRGRDVLVAAPGVGLTVRGDARRLQQALSNLVTNALEHGEGLVVLGARAGEGSLLLEVTDTGPGLRSPVEALTAAAPRDGGAVRGRGLAIASEIAQRGGGTLTSHRDDAGGRHRMVLELPAGEPAPRFGELLAAGAEQWRRPSRSGPGLASVAPPVGRA